jgi:hypothetical protein
LFDAEYAAEQQPSRLDLGLSPHPEMIRYG